MFVGNKIELGMKDTDDQFLDKLGIMRQME
jgi:hypothetical protein